MELLQLKYFKTVAKIGKISEAAASLFISAPALSTSISRLEKELGVKLFDRTNNRIVLNTQGQIFLHFVNQVFSALESAKSELRQSVMMQGQYLSLACIATSQWVDLITAFSQEYPHFTLSCTSIKCSELNSSGLPVQHNFLLASEESIPAFLAAELESIVLFHDEVMIAVNNDHPLATREYVTLGELMNETLIFPMQNYTLYDHLVKLFETENLPIPSGNEHAHLAGMHLAKQGFGIAFIYKHATVFSQDGLRYIPIKTACPHSTFRLYWRKSHVFTEDEATFKDFTDYFYHHAKLA